MFSFLKQFTCLFNALTKPNHLFLLFTLWHFEQMPMMRKVTRLQGNMLQFFKNSFIPGITIYYDGGAYICVRVCAFECTYPQRQEVGVTGGCELGVKLGSSARAVLTLCLWAVSLCSSFLFLLSFILPSFLCFLLKGTEYIAWQGNFLIKKVEDKQSYKPSSLIF